MRTDQFLAHHGVQINPFAEEDAQTDQVFRSHCTEVRHPAWDKVFGDATNPATSIVFGEKGAGKTAMRLQIAEALQQHNAKAKDKDRIWVVKYDDFNPLLDHFADRLSARKQREPSKVLAEWKLWDHMDGILSIAVTDLVDHLLSKKSTDVDNPNQANVTDARRNLDSSQKRDLLLLAACYDASTAEPHGERWKRLRSRLWYSNLRASGWFWLGMLTSLTIFGIIGYLGAWNHLATPWPYLVAASAWVGWGCKWWNRHKLAWGIGNNVRVLRRERGTVREILTAMRDRDLDNQPLPNRRRTDDRYELLTKLLDILRSLGSRGMIVLVDRVDEPHLTGGRVEHMRDFIWSMLDNKFLKQPGVGIKLLLPAELGEHLNREDRDFHQRARIDKQNVIPSLDWTGEALSDLANARLQGCAEENANSVATLRDLIDPAVNDSRLIEALRLLRTPRHMFKFLYRLITNHCNAHSDSEPVWQIMPETFEAVLAVYSREQASIDRGLSAS